MNAKHELFIREYLKAGNATRAAIAAGYSPRSAGTQGSRLLADESIAAEIATRQAATINAPAGLAIDRETVLTMLSESFEIGRETRNAAAMAGAAVKIAEMVGIGPAASDPAAQALNLAAVEAEARKLVAEKIGLAMESVGLPRDATTAQLVGACTNIPVVPPAVFWLMHQASLQQKALSQ